MWLCGCYNNIGQVCILMIRYERNTFLWSSIFSQFFQLAALLIGVQCVTAGVVVSIEEIHSTVTKVLHENMEAILEQRYHINGCHPVHLCITHFLICYLREPILHPALSFFQLVTYADRLGRDTPGVMLRRQRCITIATDTSLNLFGLYQFHFNPLQVFIFCSYRRRLRRGLQRY